MRSYLTQHQQYDDDDQDDAEQARWPVAPRAAVRPGREGADEQQDQPDQQDGSDGHLMSPFRAVGKRRGKSGRRASAADLTMRSKRCAATEKRGPSRPSESVFRGDAATRGSL